MKIDPVAPDGHSPTPTRPPMAFRVCRPFRAPLPVAVGEVLVAWPEHPTHPLLICSPDGRKAIRWTALPAPRLYRLLFRAWLDAALRPMSVDTERRLLGVPPEAR